MDDAVSMGLVERVRDLDGILKGVIERKRALLQSVSKRLSFQVLHHQEIDAVLLTDVEDGTDVRMTECRERLGFTREALLQLETARDMLGQDLDRDDAIEAGVVAL